MMEFYGYDKCGTCRNAKKYLDGKKIQYKDIDITSRPPSKKLFVTILKEGTYGIKDLFNKSGVLYREMNMRDKIKTMKEADLVQLLAKNGKLVKRPIISDGKKHTVGFDEVVFKKNWK